MSVKISESQRKYNAEYYQKNKNKHSDYYQEYYDKNREKILSRVKENYAEKPKTPKKRGRPRKNGTTNNDTPETIEQI